MKIELLSITQNAEKICERSARTCYDSGSKITDDSYQKMLTALLKSGHLSVFEHASASFMIEGISRAASHQIVRHRHSSFSQRSQRYVNENGFDFVTPQAILDNPDAISIYNQSIQQIQDAYQQLINLGIKKEDARFLMPNAATTTLAMTANFREWLHIIDMRVAKGAQWEIRNLCILIWKQLYKEAPLVFSTSYFENWSIDASYKQEIFDEHIA
ncbi:MAG: FAD-dependent thymidylate synthase [Brevinema sp.]